MVANPKRPDISVTDAVREQATALESRYGWLDSETVIELALNRFFPAEQIAVVSSFGADSAVLLHMIAKIDRSLPVLFLDTQKHFAETVNYRDSLVSDLGLTDVQVVRPDPDMISAADPEGDLHKTNPDTCCRIRKTDPMAGALAPFSAWFTGRKRFQSGSRKSLAVFEAVDDRLRINPLALLTSDDIKSYLYTNDLRRHPLVAYGYLSIGCQPCTAPVKPGETERSGRWTGTGKTECGIHISADGKIVPLSSMVGAL